MLTNRINNMAVGMHQQKRQTKKQGVKSNSYNAQRNNKSLAQVVMKEDKANTSFRNNNLNKSTAYKARKVEKEDEREVSNEELSSEGEQEDQECKSVMRVGVQSETIKELFTEKMPTIKDKNVATSNEKIRKNTKTERIIDEAVRKGKVLRKIKIGDRVFDAILDTGSQVTIIKEE